MDENTKQLLARLEQATLPKSPGSDGSGELDAEAAELRASWLALRKLLEAADDESQRAAPRRRTALPGRLRWLGIFAAMAASLLIALAAWKIVERGASETVPLPEVAVPGPRLPESAPKIAEMAAAPVDEQSAATVDEFAWDDSFDEQLAATSQAIRSARADFSSGDRRYAVLLDQLEQFHDELSEGSL